MALRRPLAVALAALLLAAAAAAQPGGAASPDPASSPDPTQGGLGVSPATDDGAGASPDPAASPDPVASPAASPDPIASSPDTWQASPQPDASPTPSPSGGGASPDPWSGAGTGASPTPSPAASSPNPWAAAPSSPTWDAAPTPSSPTPVVAAPSPSPSPPPPPPPPPAGTLVNLAVLIDGAASPLADDVLTIIAQDLSALTPGFAWTYTAQQPALPDVPPTVPVVALPPSAAVPAATPAAAPGAVTVVAAAAPADVPLEQLRVTVDPLALNQGVLGGRRRLRQTNLLDLPKTEKGQCWSTKHPLVPDEPTCLAYCDALLAAGKLTADEMSPKFYDNEGNLCCRCQKKKEDAAGAPSAAPGAGAAAPSKPAAAAPATPKPAAPAATTPVPAAVPVPVAVPAPPAAPVPYGVFYFASARVMVPAQEVSLNATLRAALGSGALLQKLQQTTGLSIKAVHIMHLASGPWAFAPLPQRYERAAEDHGSGGEVATGGSTGPNKGVMLGAILGGVCVAVIAITVVVVVVSRRRRSRKFDGQSAVRRWEAERQQAEEYRRQQQDQRRQASQKALDKLYGKSGRSTSSLGSSRSAAAAPPARSPRIAGGLDRLRRGLGLGPRDHLAAAAARMEAAEAAAAATPAPVITLNAVQPAAPAEPAQVAAAPASVRAVAAPPAAQQLGAAPSWASRDPGTAPRPGLFSGLFGRKA